MSLRRSSRIQQASTYPTPSTNGPLAANARNVTVNISSAKNSKNASSKRAGIKGNDTSGKKGVAAQGTAQLQPQLRPRPQQNKRRRLDGAEIRDAKSKNEDKKGGDAREAKPYGTEAPELSAEQASRTDGVAVKDGDKDEAAELVKTTNVAKDDGTVTAASPMDTDNVLEKANAYIISQDPKLADIIERYPCEMFSPKGLQEVVHPFQHLVTGIMAQQVSGAATAAIKSKFINLFTPPSFPTPAKVASADLSLLRTAGLSGRKAEYVKGLAEKFDNGELTKEMLATASDEEVMSKLTAVRGLGRWSAEMFAFFGLKRTDVFATGDLGVQRGMAAYLGKDVNKLKSKGGGKWKYLSEREMLDYSAKFSPYRSFFMWYMWKIQDANVNALEQKS